jgi:hypothetical protein
MEGAMMPVEIVIPAYNAPPSLAAKHEATIGEAIRQRTLDEGWVPRLPHNGRSEGVLARQVIDDSLEPAIVGVIKHASRPLSIAEIAVRLGFDREGVGYAVHRMVARGQVIKHRAARSVRWSVPHHARGAGIGSPTSTASVCFPRLPARKQ